MDQCKLELNSKSAHSPIAQSIFLNSEEHNLSFADSVAAATYIASILPILIAVDLNLEHCWNLLELISTLKVLEVLAATTGIDLQAGIGSNDATSADSATVIPAEKVDSAGNFEYAEIADLKMVVDKMNSMEMSEDDKTCPAAMVFRTAALVCCSGLPLCRPALVFCSADLVFRSADMVFRSADLVFRSTALLMEVAWLFALMVLMLHSVGDSRVLGIMKVHHSHLVGYEKKISSSAAHRSAAHPLHSSSRCYIKSIPVNTSTTLTGTTCMVSNHNASSVPGMKRRPEESIDKKESPRKQAHTIVLGKVV
ncbi:hypothetical protein ZIOFF_029163 [Zingiber officinale]|uniref:Uncharacterized protein n=1 Tax=Zingiber officinale TaxID=94328 RepID=A0A8J5H7R4_ZINOF|nr:hypothetical protein ZIOFF_029163 [Zingiber officinale]